MEYSKHKSVKERWRTFIDLAKNPKAFFRYYLIDYHLDYNPEPVKYRKDTRRGLLWAFHFAFMFGIYENLWAFSIFDTPQLVWVHWILWWLTTTIIAYFATNRRWDLMVIFLLFVINFEDVIFWMMVWLRNGTYPYPAGNWWDPLFASFRVLGNWGTAVSFFPYVPRYYFVVGGLLIPYYFMTILGGSKFGQVLAWIYLPAIVPVLIGLVVSEIVFIIILATSTGFFYSWGIYLIVLAQKRKKMNLEKIS